MSVESQSVPNLPSEHDLKKLPLRALVAFASRCARRVQPIFKLPHSVPDADKHTSVFIKAITLAEAFSRGEAIGNAEAYKSGVAASDASEAANKLSTGIQAALAATAAAETAFAVYAATSDLSTSNAIVAKAFMTAADAGDHAVDKVFLATRAAHTANFAARASGFSAQATTVVIPHIRRDFEKLAELQLGSYPDIGQPVDPCNTGPLGSLWLNDAPIWYAVDDSHPFYDEMLQFCVSAISLQALLISSLLQRAAQSTKGTAVASEIGAGVPIIELPDLRLEMHLLDTDCKEECIVNTTATVDYLIGTTGRPVQLLFAVRPLPGFLSSESEVKGRLDVHVGQSLQTVACYLVGGAYVKHENRFVKLGTRRTGNPELQFFRHLRNGCFHGNKFNIEKIQRKNKPPLDQIDPANPPRWGAYVMPSDNTMNGQTVMDGFFRLPHLMPFLYDMGKYV